MNNSNNRNDSYRVSNPDFNGDGNEDVVFAIHEPNYSIFNFLLNQSDCPPICTEENVNICSGSDYTYPDGTTETSITANTSHISNLVSQVTGCDSIVTTNITVNEVYATNEEESVCSGEDHTYTDGTTASNITANTSHISNLASQITGCDSTITTNISVNDIYATTEEVSVCSGDDYTYPDGTVETIIIANTSHISNLVSEVTGCDSTVTTNISVINVNTNVTVDGNTITAENNTADAYQWFNCDLELSVDGETTFTFTAIGSGDYAVAIEENNCVDTSVCNSIVISGIHDKESIVQAIWPNPTTGRINIRLTENNAPVEISIYDVIGKLILQKEVEMNQTIFTTDLPGESEVYFIQIKSKSKTASYKILKK